MNVSKSNLVAILLEVGEENAAALLSRSNLPDEIDLQRDLDHLKALGLDGDQVDEIAQLTIGGIESDAVDGQRHRGEMETTIRGDGLILSTSGWREEAPRRFSYVTNLSRTRCRLRHMTIDGPLRWRIFSLWPIVRCDVNCRCRRRWLPQHGRGLSISSRDHRLR